MVVGFSYIYRLLSRGLELDRALIIALVEEWRQDTYTFHVTVEEATITLLDVYLDYWFMERQYTCQGGGQWSALMFELLRAFPLNP